MVRKPKYFDILFGPRGSGKLAIKTGSPYRMWGPMIRFKIKKK